LVLIVFLFNHVHGYAGACAPALREKTRNQ